MIIWGKIESRLLLPEFVQDINDLLGPCPYNWYVTEGFRSIERSDALYAAYKAYLDKAGPPAPRAAPGGKSAHNFGLAIDVALDSDLHKPGLQPDWNPGIDNGKADGWLWLRGKVNAHPRLRGGWWYADWPHIERYKWERHKDWKAAA